MNKKIIHKVLDGKATAAEVHDMMCYIKTPEGEMALLDQMQADLEHATKSPLHQPTPHPKRIWQTVAAVTLLIISVGIGAFCLGASRHHGLPQGTMVVKTGIGEHGMVTLPDGTEVIMNSMSSISYDCSMTRGERRVTLKGEGYFRVAKDKNHPFIVETDEVNITCLGTEFNVRNYAEENEISVVVTEGKVRVDASESYLTMGLNHRVVYTRGSTALNKQVVKAENYTHWLNGEVEFCNETLENITLELARNYNLSFYIMDDELRQVRFNGYLGKCSLRNVLDILCVTSDMEYRIDKDTLVYLYRRN